MDKLSLNINNEDILISGIPNGGWDVGINALRVGVELALIAAIIVTLFSIIWAGFQYMTSAGDSKKTNQALRRILFSVIGLAIVLLSFMIIGLISYFFHIEFPGIPSSVGGTDVPCGIGLFKTPC